MTPAISICTPTYELNNRGVVMLNKMLESCDSQSFKDFEIVISDHSIGDEIKNLCNKWSNLNIKYIRNEKHRGSCEQNLNNAIDNASGEYIKPLLQDDFFASNEALQLLFDMIRTTKSSWVAAGCIHCREDDVTNFFYPHPPGWVPGIHMALGHNLVGSPSVVMYPKYIVNKATFDHNLIWLMDCEFYARLSNYLGAPLLVKDKIICIRMRHDSISDSVITGEIIEEEKRYVEAKFNQRTIDLKSFPLMYERLGECQLL